ncbi:hypothetical protein VNO78_10796 [Psophocarpus tetragonolobus]|uniref:Uncharacterized protein n=1 Tax=Psophocarpus tetragonolobus TaxID=3891 RepID=A0AAN9XMV1_PSOTE
MCGVCWVTGSHDIWCVFREVKGKFGYVLTQQKQGTSELSLDKECLKNEEAEAQAHRAAKLNEKDNGCSGR